MCSKYILATVQSHLKKFHSILRFWQDFLYVVPTFFYKLRSDNWITPKCTLLNFTSKTEAICENEETQARIMYSDASVVNRISDCSTYFRKFPNVAYKKVLKNPHFFKMIGFDIETEACNSILIWWLLFSFQRTIYELRTPLAFVIVAHSHLGLLGVSQVKT